MKTIKYRAWDNGKMHKVSFNNLSVNHHHPKGTIYIRDENKPFGKSHETILMQCIGLKDNNEVDIYENDILSLKIENIEKENAFWNSNLGQLVKEHELEEVILTFGISEYLEIKYEVSFLKNNEKFTEKERWKDENAEGLFTEKDTGSLFPRYLLKKGAVVVGNVYENPNLAVLT